MRNTGKSLGYSKTFGFWRAVTVETVERESVDFKRVKRESKVF